MKTMTCSELGGPCDAKMTTATKEEMMKVGMEHVEAVHPEMATKIKAMTKEETDKWAMDFDAKWMAKPEDM